MADKIEDLYVHPKNPRAKVYEKDGWYWVTAKELELAGYEGETFKIVMLNEEFYEILGFSRAAGAWWLEHIPIEGAFDGNEEPPDSEVES